MTRTLDAVVNHKNWVSLASSSPLISLFRWASVSVSAAVAGLLWSWPKTLTIPGVMEEYNWCNDSTSGKEVLRWARIGCQQSLSYWGFFILSLCKQFVLWLLLNCCVTFLLQSNANKKSSISSLSHVNTVSQAAFYNTSSGWKNITLEGILQHFTGNASLPKKTTSKKGLF